MVDEIDTGHVAKSSKTRTGDTAARVPAR
jgi:hypothetical protein